MVEIDLMEPGTLQMSLFEIKTKSSTRNFNADFDSPFYRFWKRERQAVQMGLYVDIAFHCTGKLFNNIIQDQKRFLTKKVLRILR